MRYPTLSAADAGVYLTAKRNGAPIDSDALVNFKGSGSEFDGSFVEELRSELAELQTKCPNAGRKAHADGNRFEGAAARAVHRHLPPDAEILSDPEFWIWLAVVCFPDVVEWRYGNVEGGTKWANYGIGSRIENFLYRLWLRAELVLDEHHEDRYHLVEAGQIDFYRSHLVRKSYANARPFARAFLRFQYPNDDASPRLKLLQIRDLAKRIGRLRTNLFLEILPEEECRAVIESEAAVVVAAQ